MTLRVCLIAPLPPPYGGISHWASMLERYTRLHADDVELRVLDTAPKWRAVHDIAIWKRVFGGAIQLVRDFFSFIMLLFSWRPDVVHVTTSGHLALVRDILILSLLRVLRVRTVYHLHFGRVPDIFLKKGLEFFFFRIAACWATQIVSIDRNTYNALIGILGENKVSLVPNFYDQTKIPTIIKPPSKRVLFLGWVIYSKGLEELIAAWNICHPTDWVLSIIGPSEVDYVEFLKSQCQSNHIEFLGEMKHDDAMFAMSEASIFVLPSHTEGFPNVVVEAMAMGKAIIATDVGAIPEMLGSDRGVLVPSRNIEKLANALKRVMDDVLLQKNLGMAAREFAQSHYSIQSVFQLYLALWSNGQK